MIFFPIGIEPVIAQIETIIQGEDWINTASYEANIEGLQESMDEVKREFSINQDVALDKTGTKNVTALIQRYIDGLPTGSVVRFDTGTYRISNLNLKSGITYDFGNSIIISDDPNYSCMQCVSEQVAAYKLAADSVENNNVFTLSSVDGLQVGQLISFMDKTHRIHVARRYYYSGFNTIITSIDAEKKQITTQDTIPYKLYAETTTCDIYNPSTCIIRNVKDGVLNGAAVYPSDFIAIKNCINCLVENVHTTHGFSHVIKYQSCVNCIVRSCNVLYPTLDENFNADHPYFVAVLESTNTLCDNITGINAWHVVVTSPYTTCLNTHIINSNCVSTVTTGIQDHENAYGTTIESCSANRIGVSGGAVIRNCTVLEKIYLVPESHTSMGVYTIENCEILEPEDYAIRIHVSPKIEGGVYGFDSITIKGLRFPERREFGFLADYDGRSVTIEDCENLWFDIRRSSTIDEVAYRNCRINMDVNPDKAASTINYYFTNLLFENCTFYSNGNNSFFASEQKWKLRPSSLLRMNDCVFDYNNKNFAIFLIDGDAIISNCTSIGNITAKRNIHFVPGHNIEITNSEFHTRALSYGI